MRQISVVRFQATDGKLFETLGECKKYEKETALKELIESEVGFTHSDDVYSFIRDNKETVLSIIGPSNIAEYVMLMSGLRECHRFDLEIGNNTMYNLDFSKNFVGNITLFNGDTVVTDYNVLECILNGKGIIHLSNTGKGV